MNWMDKLEKKWGRYAIPNINRYLVFAVIIGYLISRTGSEMLNFLAFDVQSILHGQVWRLITWVLIPPSSAGGINFALTLLFLFCLIPMGRSLEMFFGTFKMNVYYIGGILFCDVAGILVYVITLLLFGAGIPVYMTTYYLLLSTFMALALCMPDATVNLYFVLPIKMKWMLIIYFAELGYEIFNYFRASWLVGIIYGSEIVFALANLGLFFYFAKRHVSHKQRKRQKEFRSQFNTNPRPGSGISKHKCAICGRTELDDPGLVFRYCSKCDGNYEYCQDHLFTHQHIKHS